MKKVQEEGITSDVLTQFYKSLNTKPTKEIKRPQCGNVMLKYSERILRQEIKAVDPYAYLIREEELQAVEKAKQLFQPDGLSRKAIQIIAGQYSIKSTLKPATLPQRISPNYDKTLHQKANNQINNLSYSSNDISLHLFIQRREDY